MSSNREHVGVTPGYILWVILFVLGFSVAEYAIGAGVYYLMFGAPTLSEWTTLKVPDYSHATSLKDRVVYPVAIIGPGNPFGKAALVAFDPESGKSEELKYRIDFPTNGLATDREIIWAVSPSAVVRNEIGVSTEFKTKRLLNRISNPFIYEGQLAVVDLGKNGPPTLLVFKQEIGDWGEIGPVILPYSFASSRVNEKLILVPIPATTPIRTSLLDLQVVVDGGRMHTFLSDGAVVAYREGIELAPVSALAPANVADFPDLSNLDEWSAVCNVSPGIGGPGKLRWKATMVDGQPTVVTVAGTLTPNPFQGAALEAYSRQGKDWTLLASVSTPALIEVLAVSNDKACYVAGNSIMQILRFQKLVGKEFKPTGTVIRAQTLSFQEALTKWAELINWVYWIGLVLMSLGITRLMTEYRGSEYQFGIRTVEFASFTRRVIARMIDYFIYVLPLFAINRLFGMGSQEQIEQNMDRMFDAGPDGMLRKFALVVMCSVMMGLIFLIMNSILQARWGVTLGKWICGIRTIGSTLRPCGFPRALVREIFLIGETLMAGFSIPVTLLIAFTEKRQRLGDMVADTIVIRKPQIPEDSESLRETVNPDGTIPELANP